MKLPDDCMRLGHLVLELVLDLGCHSLPLAGPRGVVLAFGLVLLLQIRLQSFEELLALCFQSLKGTADSSADIVDLRHTLLAHRHEHLAKVFPLFLCHLGQSLSGTCHATFNISPILDSLASLDSCLLSLHSRFNFGKFLRRVVRFIRFGYWRLRLLNETNVIQERKEFGVLLLLGNNNGLGLGSGSFDWRALVDDFGGQVSFGFGCGDSVGDFFNECRLHAMG
ncbi:unnamed protein product [Mycena citricolor]|uniref:Uncharacterized protein n=1 Tax=Mycena citricolor TaxID=2018698 RepID=A0AAD2H1T2_9AGAR|nr:unnamed protein product [Mycena citricolor]